MLVSKWPNNQTEQELRTVYNILETKLSSKKLPYIERIESGMRSVKVMIES